MLKLYDMKKVLLFAAVALMCSFSVGAQSNLKKVYDETANPMQQIDQAVSKAAKSDKNVICQLGGNWCRWCLMFADYITKDTEISQFIDENPQTNHWKPEQKKQILYFMIQMYGYFV